MLRFFGSSTLVSLLFLLGCSSPKESSPAQPPSAEPKPAAEAPAPAPAVPKAGSEPLRIAYSDWPGWVAWEIGLQKKWFEEEGVRVDFKWFEYVPSMEAFSAGKVDAVTMTNGDALVTGSSGAPSVAILLNDFSNGNDMVVARPGIKNVAALKGKKVGVEVGFVSHLLLINALKSAGLTDKDVSIVNVPTDQTPQLLKSGEVDAVVAWQPNSGQALSDVAGSKAIYTSADVPGIIYDVLAVNPKSLSERRDEWKKVVKVWLRIADYLKQPENLEEAAKIMAARVGMDAAKYQALMQGTFFLDLAGNLKHFRAGDSLESVFFSDKVVDEFQVKNDVYKKPVDFSSYLDSSLLTDLAASVATAK
jgi:NitT/TauT family transport system substrate-binding protein